MTIALLHNFFEIIFWFATTYITFQFTFEDLLESVNPIIVIYYSFITMVSFTANLDKNNGTLITATILHMQEIIGLFMTILSFVRFVSLFPKPETFDQKRRSIQSTIIFNESNNNLKRRKRN